MKNYRIHYAVVFILTAALTFVFGTKAAVAVLSALAALPVLSGIAFGIEAKSLVLRAALSSNYELGLRLRVTIESRPISIALGGVYIRAEFKNSFFDIVKEELYYLPLSSKGQTEAFIPVDDDFCGRLKVSIKEASAGDILGLVRKKIKPPKELNAVVYPRGYRLNAVPDRRHESSSGENHYDNRKKGSDVSEIFDLRTYAPGDSLRAIHWKLSVKTKDLIIKEGSKPSNFDTLLYIDFGKATGEGELKKEFMRSVAEAGFYISESLIESGARHELALPSQKEIFRAPVEDRNSCFSALEQALSLNAADVCGKWFESIPSGEITSRYSKLIYVAWEEYPKALEHMSDLINITVIMLYDNSDKAMEAVDYNNLKVIAIGARELYDRQDAITV